MRSDLRRDRSHHLGGQAERAGIEGGIADGWRAQRIEMRRKVPVHAERLDQGHRRRHVIEHLGATGPGASSRFTAGVALTS